MHSTFRKTLRTSIEKLSGLRTRTVEFGRGVRTQVANSTPGERRVAAGMALAGVVTASMLAGAVAMAGTTPSTITRVDTRAYHVAAGRAHPGRAAQPARHASASAKKAVPKAAPKAAPKWVAPMAAPLSSCFGPRWGIMHMGIDFAGDDGTKIRAVGSGTVFGAGWVYAGYGQSVVIDHGNGYFSHYAHASKVLVHEGQHVKPGQVIALEGSTGDSTGPHLHFEVHKGMWNQINPAGWLRSHGVKLGC